MNAYLIYREHYDTSRMTILQFCESVVRILLLVAPSEKLKPSPERTFKKSKELQADGSQARRQGRTYAKGETAYSYARNTEEYIGIRRNTEISLKR